MKIQIERSDRMGFVILSLYISFAFAVLVVVVVVILLRKKSYCFHKLILKIMIHNFQLCFR